MKRFIVFMSVMALILGIGGTAVAAPVTFTFDAPTLPFNSNPTAISTYMTNIYGSTVTATGNILHSSTLDLLGNQGANDGYLESDQFNATHTITIAFTAPIIGAYSFDWGTNDDSFHFDVLTGSGWVYDVFQVASQTGKRTGAYSNTFAVPVYALAFHDNYTVEVGIDNLTVNRAVPEPMSLLLLGLGLLGIGVVRRKK